MLKAGFLAAALALLPAAVQEDVSLMRLAQAGATPIGWLAALMERGHRWDGPHGEGMREIIAAHWPASTVGPVDDTTPGQGGLETFAE